MADRLGFHKPQDPAFNGEEDGGVVDFATSNLTFQMVPMGGRRLASVLGLAERACQVVIEAPQVVQFGSRKFNRLDTNEVVAGPPTLDRFIQALPANHRMEFELVPISVGSTVIVMEANGGGLASMRVSVKADRKVTISACRLVDLEFVNKFDDATIRLAMARAKFTYKNTANITLIDDPTIYPVECDIGLGNPIVLGRAITEYDTRLSTVHDHIVRKTPAAAKAASVVAVFGWDFEIQHLPIVGLQSGRFCFVEFDPKPHNRNMTLEHEIGHAMGLGHTTVLSIMNGDGFNGLERFEPGEIDILNP